MLHHLHGDILGTNTSSPRGNDTRWRTLAVRDGDDISVVVCNPRGVSEKCRIEIHDLPAGKWSVRDHMCDSDLNNCVTGSGTGAPGLACTGSSDVEVAEGGVLKLERELERDAFLLINLKKA